MNKQPFDKETLDKIQSVYMPEKPTQTQFSGNTQATVDVKVLVDLLINCESQLVPPNESVFEMKNGTVTATTTNGGKVGLSQQSQQLLFDAMSQAKLEGKGQITGRQLASILGAEYGQEQVDAFKAMMADPQQRQNYFRKPAPEDSGGIGK